MLLPKNLVARMTISIALNFVWGSMNDMSNLTLLSLISISVPGIAKTFMKILLKFIYLDVLMTDDWLLPLLVSENKAYYGLDENRRILDS